MPRSPLPRPASVPDAGSALRTSRTSAPPDASTRTRTRTRAGAGAGPGRLSSGPATSAPTRVPEARAD